MVSFEKQMEVWKPLKEGQPVRVTTKYRNGERGVIKERLDDQINGWGRYGVQLDSSPSRTTDFLRFELTHRV